MTKAFHKLLVVPCLGRNCARPRVHAATGLSTNEAGTQTLLPFALSLSKGNGTATTYGFNVDTVVGHVPRTQKRKGMHAFLRWGRLLSFSIGLFFLSVPAAHTLPWNDDMYWQPELKAGTAARAPAAHSVPTTGIEPPISSRITDRIKAGITLRNPVKATAQSIQNGAALYRIYCTPCHGPQAKGDGIMVGKVVPSSNLHTDRMKNQKDGYLYATIRSGGFIMPSYQHALSTRERWDIVNYVRQLQQDLQQLQQPQQ